MNEKLLDNQLRRLTDVEMQYKKENGGKEGNYDGLLKIKSRGGADCFVMRMSKGGEPTFPFQFHPHIIITRHTRFVPVHLHSHEWIELSYMYSGSCSQTINEEDQVQLTKGQMILLDRDSIHSIGDTADDDILVNLLFDKDYFDERFFSHFSEENILLKFLLNSISEKKIHDNYILFHSEKSSRIRLFMQELMIEFLTPPSESSVDVIDNLINLIFLELVNVYRSEMITSQLNLGKSNSIAVMKYIEANYRTCTLNSVAELFKMNPNYLTMMLKKNTGYTFKELIQHYRFNYVTTMLSNTREPVDQIVFQAGYENTTYFYKKFKERYGCTPKQYRETHFNSTRKVLQR